MKKFVVLAFVLGLISVALFLVTREANAPDAHLPDKPTVADTLTDSAVPSAAPVAPATTAPDDSAREPAPSGATIVHGMARDAETGAGVAGVGVAIIVNAVTDHQYKAVTADDGSYSLIVAEEVPERGADVVWRRCKAPSDDFRAEFEGKGLRLRAAQTHELNIIVTENKGAISGTVYAEHVVWRPDKLPEFQQRMERLQRTKQQDADRQHPYNALIQRQKSPRAGIVLKLSTGALAQSDATGRYRFDHVPPGRIEVMALLPLEAPRMANDLHESSVKTVEVADTVVTGVDLVINFDGVTVTGRVVDPRGRPIPHAAVVAEPMGMVDDSGGIQISTKAVRRIGDADGRFVLNGLVAPDLFSASAYVRDSSFLPKRGNTYSIVASAKGYAPAQVVVPAVPAHLLKSAGEFLRIANEIYPQHDGDGFSTGPDVPPVSGTGNEITGVEIVLEPEAVVAGYVVDTTGAAVSKCRVHMAHAEEAPKPAAFARGTTPPDWIDAESNGAFVFTAVPSGEYIFEVDTGLGAQRARNAPMVVKAGTTYADVQVVVESALDRGIIEGHITVPEGAKVPEHWLRVSSVVSPNEPSPRFGKVSIDPVTGMYRIDGLSAGTVTLEGQTEGYPLFYAEIDVEAGRVSRHDIHLVPEGILRGTVTRNGEPSRHGYVTFPEIEHAPYGHLGEQGEYEVKNLAPGRYLVRYTMWLYEDDRGGAQLADEAIVEIMSGKETRMDIAYVGNAIVHGEFSAPDEAKWFVRIEDERIYEESKLRASTWKFEHNGRYEIPGLAPGTYTVVGQYTLGEEEPVIQSRQIELHDGGEVQVDFSFP